HVRCVRCGCVADVCGPAPAPALEGLQAAGFAILGARIELDGLCERCAAAAAAAGTNPAFSPENPAHGGSHE
ncbi:MAG: hypothetical protein K2G99_05120, partial [Desulfovibrio sp.]|nr:hypothetical protein [Desulfovibrio sp.]